jgi:hypothetical protein
MPKALTVRLDVSDYERLEAEARELGMRPGQLARAILHSHVPATATRTEKRLAALEALAGLAEGGPPVDAAALVAEAREETATRIDRQLAALESLRALARRQPKTDAVKLLAEVRADDRFS